jgi:glycogen synthase
MQERGIEIMYGRWLIEGAPRVLLINTGTGYRWLDEWKGDLWTQAGIPSPASDHETNEAIVLGYLVAWFLGEVSKSRLNQQIFTHMSSSSFRGKPSELLSRSSTNGSQVLPFLSPRSVKWM